MVRGLLDTASDVEMKQVTSSAWSILDSLKVSVAKVISLENDKIKEIKQTEMNTHVEKLRVHLACLPVEFSERELLMTSASFLESFLLAGSSVDSQHF